MAANEDLGGEGGSLIAGAARASCRAARLRGSFRAPNPGARDFARSFATNVYGRNARITLLPEMTWYCFSTGIPRVRLEPTRYPRPGAMRIEPPKSSNWSRKV